MEARLNNEFPFLTHSFTKSHLKTCLVIFIMRGVPGSGKSTIVSQLEKVFHDCVVCSADSYFYRDGVYMWAADKLKEAHDSCRETAKNACENRCNCVIIDNTNIKKWETIAYLQLAYEHRYDVILITPRQNFSVPPDQLAARNIHQVPESSIVEKLKNFEEMIPLYYGWFLNTTDSEELLTLGKECLAECLLKIKPLEKMLRSQACSPDEDLVNKYFTREKLNNNKLHCTAKFCGHGKEPRSVEYSRRRIVQESCGKAFTLVISGLIISSKTIGLRIKLNDEELDLWGSDETKYDGPQKVHSLNDSISNGQKRDKIRQLPSDTVESLSKGMNAVSLADKIGFKKGDRAHVTLGCVSGVTAVQTGRDLLQAIELDRNSKPEVEKNTTFGNVKYFKEGYCLLELNKERKYVTTFTGHY